MSEHVCERCGRAAQDASLCTRCRLHLEVAVVNVAAYWTDLETVVRAGRVRFGTGGSRPARGEHRLGLDARFAPGRPEPDAPIELGVADQLSRDVQVTLRRWALYVIELGVEDRPSSSSVDKLSVYLLRRADDLRVSARGAEALRELTAIEGRLQRLIDRPRDRWFAGPCGAALGYDEQHNAASCSCWCHRSEDGCDEQHDSDCVPGWELDHETSCTEPLYADSERGVVTCKACGATYDVRNRREYLLKAAEDLDAPASTIARALTVWGAHEGDAARLRDRIAKWGSPERRRIFPTRHAPVDGVVRPLYRIGEVMDLLAEDARAAERRQLKRKANG